MLSRLKRLFPDCSEYHAISLLRLSITVLPTNTPYREENLVLGIVTTFYYAIYIDVDALPGHLTRFVVSVLGGKDASTYVGIHSDRECWFSYDPETGLWFVESGEEPLALPLCWKIFAALLQVDKLRGTYHAVNLKW